jgi:hypothetical protein
MSLICQLNRNDATEKSEAMISGLVTGFFGDVGLNFAHLCG